MNWKQFSSRPSIRKLPKAEQLRRYTQHIKTLKSGSRVKPGRSYAAVVKTKPKVEPLPWKRVIPKKKARPMKKTTRKSTNSGAKKVEKAYGMGNTRSVLTIDPNRLVSWTPLKPYPGPQGFHIYPMMFQVLWDSPTTDGTGKLQYTKQIKSDMFPQLAVEVTRFKRFRLRELLFVFRPKRGMNVDGTAACYVNYASDAAVPATLQDVVKREGALAGMVPFKRYQIKWRAQDNKDTEFVTAGANVQFNPDFTHWLKIYGDGLPSAVSCWDLYAYGIVELTEYFN